MLWETSIGILTPKSSTFSWRENNADGAVRQEEKGQIQTVTRSSRLAVYTYRSGWLRYRSSKLLFFHAQQGEASIPSLWVLQPTQAS